MDSFFRVLVHTTGRRLGDCDGRSAKALLDGFTKAGIWPDDNAVVEICFTQTKTNEDDATIITIFETPPLDLLEERRVQTKKKENKL